jgi:hypothetical protein
VCHGLPVDGFSCPPRRNHYPLRDTPPSLGRETLVHTETRAVPSPSAAQRADQLGSPHAARMGRARWLDPRLIIGVLLVLGSVVAGTRVIAAADHTVPVLVAATNLAPGQPLTPDLVEPRRVKLDGNLDRYLTGAVGRGYVVVRAVGEGELLPRSSIAAASDDRALRYVTISLPAAEVPVGLAGGDLVDVWEIPPPDATNRAASLLLSGVGVTDSDSGSDGLTTVGGQARVTLAVTPATGGRSSAELDEAIGALIPAARAGLVYLTVVPEAAQ